MAIECTKMSWQDIPVLLIRTKNVLAGHFRSNGSCMTIECTKNVLAGHSCSAYSSQNVLAGHSCVSDFPFLFWKKQLYLLAFCKQSRPCRSGPFFESSHAWKMHSRREP